MTKPDYERLVYAAQFPVFISSDGKRYFIFQTLNEDGVAVDPIFYRDIAEEGTSEIMQTVIRAFTETRKLKVYLNFPSLSYVAKVELGEHHHA